MSCHQLFCFILSKLQSLWSLMGDVRFLALWNSYILQPNEILLAWCSTQSGRFSCLARQTTVDKWWLSGTCDVLIPYFPFFWHLRWFHLSHIGGQILFDTFGPQAIELYNDKHMFLKLRFFGSRLSFFPDNFSCWPKSPKFDEAVHLYIFRAGRLWYCVYNWI